MKRCCLIIAAYLFIYGFAGQCPANEWQGIDFQLKIMEKMDMYSPADLQVVRYAAAIFKATPSPDNDRVVADLFNKGETLWHSSLPPDYYFMGQNFHYRILCKSLISYYEKSGRLYDAIGVYKKLARESERLYALGVLLSSQQAIIEKSLVLGLIENAALELQKYQQIIDEYYLIDFKRIEKTEATAWIGYYNNAFLQLAIAMEQNQFFDQQKVIDDFDRLITLYDKHKPALQFAHINSLTRIDSYLVRWDQEDAYKEAYFTNIDLLYNFSIYFSRLGDDFRTDQALQRLKKGLLENGRGNLRGKEGLWNAISAESFVTSADTAVLGRIPLVNKYFSLSYEAEVLLNQGQYAKAQVLIEEAEQAYVTLQQHYTALPFEYQVKDGAITHFAYLQVLKGKVLEAQDNYKAAYEAYGQAVAQSELARQNIPLALRKHFFRGKSKTAYLGRIRVAAKMAEQQQSESAVNLLLSAMNQMHARQLQDLTDRDGTGLVPTLNSIQTRLTDDGLLYILYDVQNEIVVAAIGKEGGRVSVLAKHADFEKQIYGIKAQLTTRFSYDHGAVQQVSAPLFALLEEFPKARKLHIVSDGATLILPVDIYTDARGELLFKRYTVNYLTDLWPEPQQGLQANANLLALADPTYGTVASLRNKINGEDLSATRSADLTGYFTPLPETRDEALAISSFTTSQTMLFGADAREGRLKSMDLTPFNYVHIATHGVLGGEIPNMEEPALVLAAEEGEDGLLSESEVAKLTMNANLTVLSACNTGNGKYFRGEGLMGMGRAFKIAGSKQVLVSLWPVDSIATEKLMKYFYQQLQQGQTPAMALRKAKMSLQQEGNPVGEFDGYRNPFFWSAFVLVQ